MRTNVLRPRRMIGLPIFFVIASGGSAVAAPADVTSDRIFADAFDPPPVADFGSNALGVEVTFIDQSTDASGTIGAWAWDFGDGQSATSAGPVHTYPAPGTYTVTETVIDDANGESAAVSKDVTVVPCGTLTSYIHDFIRYNATGGHPDFDRFEGGIETGLVNSTITPGGVPVFKSAGNPIQLTTAAAFAQWFTDDPINFPVQQTLTLAETTPGNWSYSNSQYFPLTDKAFNDSDISCAGTPQNFEFTTMLHTQFRYNGGERLSVTGDDDIWVYINGHLVIDLGGVHGPANGSVTLNAATAVSIGISPGSVYQLDFFQANRHTCDSSLSLQTTLCLSDSH